MLTDVVGTNGASFATLLQPIRIQILHPSDMVPDHARPGRIFSGFSIYDPLPPVLVFSIMIICLNMGSSRLLSIASFFVLKSLCGDEGKASNQGYV